MRIDARQILGVFGGAVAAASLFVSGESAPSAQTAPALTATSAAIATAQSTATTDNTLTAAEKAAGWKLLFDGKSTAGWHSYQKTEAPAAGWTVVNGELTRTGQGGDLVTNDQYTDFELAIDWKIAPKGNSGIFYRGLETEERIYYTAPEYQVLDNDGHPDAKNGPDRFAGANYDLIAPSKNVCHPAGQWNSTRIIVRGAHVEHWLNGEKVVEYELWTPEWKALVANNKFKEWPSYGMAKAGYVGLQDHGDTVAFKNIKIHLLK